MQRNALGSICFLAFLLCGVSCKNVLKPYSGKAFKRSPRVRFTRALEDGAVPDEHLEEDLLDSTKIDVTRRHVNGQGDSLSGSQADALAYAQSSGLGNGLGNAQAYAESSAQGNAGPQYQYGLLESPNQMPVISDFLAFPGQLGSNVGVRPYGLGNELGSSQANAQANALSTGLASELGNAEANAQSNAQANAQSYGQGSHGLQHPYGSLNSHTNHNLVHLNRPGSNVGGRPYGSGYELENSNANVQTNALSNGVGLGNALSNGMGLGSAQANTQANALSNGLGVGNAQGSAQANALYNGLGLGNTQTNSESSALVNSGSQYLYDSLLSSDQLPNYLGSPSQSGLNVGLRPDGSGYVLGNSQANAQANAQSNALGLGNVHGIGLGAAQGNAQTNSLYNGLGNAQGNAQANALSSGLGLGSAQSQSQASAVANYDTYNLGSLERLSRESDSEEFDTQKLSQDGITSKSGAVHEVVNPFAEGYSRTVPRSRYILPHLLPGGKEFLRCSVEGELHTAWTPLHDCMVCVCLREGPYVVPHCVSCSTCEKTEPVVPMPVEPLPLPPPESQVSCDPLPTDTPFQNPVNPCQVCVCSRVFNQFGRPDIQVVCQENPQCQPQPEIHPVPLPLPRPEPIPVPEPQPEPELCVGLPINVPFRHPSDACRICVCAVDVSYGVPKEKILCQPDPQCEVKPIIIPEPVEPLPSPLPVTPEPFPVEPQPYPVEPEPLPWPPAPAPGPLPPSPLPGPPPHQSCSPYPPNQPFQHPWDQCRVCVCYEVITDNVINVEVDCFTSKLCCVEILYPDQPNQLPALPGPSVQPAIVPQVKITYIDKKCQYRGLEVEFVNPSDSCTVCQCRQYGSLVLPSCRRLPRPECIFSPVPSKKIDVVYIEPRCRTQLPHQPFSVRDQLCLCESIYHYVVAKCVTRITNYISPSSPDSFILPPYNNGQSPQYPLLAPSNLYTGGSNAQAHAFAESNVNSLHEGYLGNNQLYLPSNTQHSSGNALSEALAHAQASGQANALANAQAIGQGYGQDNAEAEANANSYVLNKKYPYYQSENRPFVLPSPNLNHGLLGDSVYQNSALAQANALANAQGYGQANADAEANANTYSNGLQGVYNPYYNGGNNPLLLPNSNLNNGLLHDLGYLSNAQSSAEAYAQANALANTQGYGQANAEANANTNSYSNGLQGVYNPYYISANNPLVLKGSDVNRDLLGNSLYQNNVLAQANALANSQGYGQANAQAEANANTYSNSLQGVYNPYFTGGNNPLLLPSSNLNSDLLQNSGYLSNALANAEAYALANAQGYGQANAEAEASANSYTGGLKDVYNPYYISANNPLVVQSPDVNHGFLENSLYQNSALAQANALANAQGYGQVNAEAEANANTYSNGLQGVYNPYYISGNNPLLHDLGYLNNAQSNAEAYAQANSLANAQGYGQANAEAEANANSYSNGLQGIYNPYFVGGNNLNNAQSSAEAYAQAQGSTQGNSLANALANSQGNSLANALAEASANSYQSGLQDIYHPFYYRDKSAQSSSAEAHAESSAEYNYGLVGAQSNQQSNAQADAYSESSAQGLGKGNLYTLYPQGNAPLNGRLSIGPLQLSAPKLYYVDKSGKSDDDLYDNEDLVSSAGSQKSLAARSLDELSSELFGLSLRDAEDVESGEKNSPQAQALTSARREGESDILESEEARR